MRSLTVDECGLVSGGLLQKPFGDIGSDPFGISEPKFPSAMDFAYLLGKNSKSASDGSSGCVKVSTDDSGNQTVTIFGSCGGSSGSSAGSWIGGTLLGAAVIGAGAGMVWGGGVAAGHVAGLGALGSLAIAEGVYAGALLGITVGVGGAVAAIIVIGGIYYAVTFNGN